jgi:hypothetical protein
LVGRFALLLCDFTHHHSAGMLIDDGMFDTEQRLALHHQERG